MMGDGGQPHGGGLLFFRVELPLVTPWRASSATRARAGCAAAPARLGTVAPGGTSAVAWPGRPPANGRDPAASLKVERACPAAARAATGRARPWLRPAAGAVAQRLRRPAKAQKRGGAPQLRWSSRFRHGLRTGAPP